MSRSLRQRRGLVVACCGVGGMDCSSTCMGSFEGGHRSLHSVQFCSVTQSCPTLCGPMDCSTPGLPVHHQLREFIHTHVHWVGDAIHPFINSTIVWSQVNSWSNGQIWPWSMDWSRAKANRVLPREYTGPRKHPLPTTQEKTLQTNTTGWSTLKSDWL